MHDIWDRAYIKYLNISVYPPTEKLCKCLIDIENNGVLEPLKILSSQIRNPEKWTATGKYSYAFYTLTVHEDKPKTSTREEVPPLVDEASWAIWKQLKVRMTPEHVYICT